MFWLFNKKYFSQNTNNASVYINSMIIGAVSMGGYLLTGSIINFIGKKKILSMYSFYLISFYFYFIF